MDRIDVIGQNGNDGLHYEMVDKIVESVRSDLKQRSEVGIQKYNTTLDRTDLDLKDWLNHAYEETLDKALYLKRAIKEIEDKIIVNNPIIIKNEKHGI